MSRNPFKYINLPDRSFVLPYTIQLQQRGVWRDVARHETAGRAIAHWSKLTSVYRGRFRAVQAERPGRPYVFAGPKGEEADGD